MSDRVSEALVAKPLPDMIKNLGLAVANANAEMAKNEGINRTAYQIHSADIEINVAITMEEGKKFEVGGGGGIAGFSVNASYARSFNFKEEASSKIKISLSAVPIKAGDADPAPAGG